MPGDMRLIAEAGSDTAHPIRLFFLAGATDLKSCAFLTFAPLVVRATTTDAFSPDLLDLLTDVLSKQHCVP